MPCALIFSFVLFPLNFPCGSAGKESACHAGDLGWIPGLGRSPGEGKGYPFQYSGLENSIDCIVHGVSKSWTRRKDFHFPTEWKKTIVSGRLERVCQFRFTSRGSHSILPTCQQATHCKGKSDVFSERSLCISILKNSYLPHLTLQPCISY